MPELTAVLEIIRRLRHRFEVAQAESEAGYSTEAIVVIALLVAMAIAAVGIISAKVLTKANGISTGP